MATISGPVRSQQLAQGVDVLGAPDERLGDQVSLESERPRNVGPVLRGQRRRRQALGRDAHPGPRSDGSAADDLGIHDAVADRRDPQLRGPVGQQDPIARPDVVGDAPVAHAGSVGAAGFAAAAGRQPERTARRENDGAAAELTETDLRAGEIGEDGDGLTGRGRRRPDRHGGGGA